MAPSSGTDEGRPAGGTARTSGMKTPRKVQWALSEKTADQDPSLSTHALDEHGLDPNAFETLTDALERHRSSSTSPLPPSLSRAPARINTENSGQDTSTTISTPNTSSPTLASPTHEVHGEHYIEPGESHGLPLPHSADFETYAQDAASKVVRAHTTRRRGLWGLGGHRKRDNKGKTSKDKGAKEKDYTDRASDVERDAELDISAPQLRGGGVLSTLLTLYDHQQTASGASTPARDSFDERGRPDRSWMRHSRAQQAPVPRPGGKVDRPPSALSIDVPTTIHVEQSSSPSSPRTPDGPTLGRSQQNGSTPSIFNLGRPPPMKNGAGSLGALIASTGNIMGAAAPTPSTLAPNIKRPGYHLSRYSLDGGIPTAQKAPKAKTLKRSSSTHFEPPTASSTLTATQPHPSGSSTPRTSSSPDLDHPQHPLMKRNWTGVLKDLPHAYTGHGWKKKSGSGSQTPTTDGGEEWLDEKAMMQEQRQKERRRKRKKAEVYITRHVAQIIQRQEFILKLTRAMMMFGGPSHRLQAQIQSTARVLDIELSCMYLPDVMLISFDDSATGTSNIKFIRQGSALDLGKLQDAYSLYWAVIHDDTSVSEASAELDKLMRKKPLYKWWQLILIGGMCSASICSVSFNGSFIDSLIVMPLGALLVSIQLLSVRNELYSNVFEITIATLLSFLAAALAETRRFCYPAVASSSVVLILPGFIVLVGSLELSSRNIVSGAVRLCFALMYSLFLGFGLAIGAEVYESITSKTIVGAQDYSCSMSHDPHGPWWQRTPSMYWAFLTVPMYSLFLSMRNQAPWNRKELLLLIVISCIGWVTNHFTGKKFPSQNDISSAVGAFAVGMVSNLYARFSSQNAFVVMITGILFQLPSGLSNGGLLTFASQQTSGSASSYLSGFETALQLISVSIGLTVGLGISLVLVHPIQSRRRAGGVFSL